MKKIYLYIVLLILAVLPIGVKAEYGLSCDSGNKDYNSSFKCYVNGVQEGVEYDEFSGTLSVPSELSCSISSVNSGLTNSGKDLRFDLKGTSSDNKVVTFSCKVVKKLNEETFVQLKIEDFKTHIKNDKEDAVEETLRSNYININKYVETTEVVVTKPRDTTNGNSLLKSATFDKEVKNDEGNKFRLSKYVTEYKTLQVTYDIKDLTLTYEKNVDAATVQVTSETNELDINGNSVYFELVDGENIIDLEVTSPEGDSITVYTLYIKHLGKGEGLYNKKEDATLSKLEVGGHNINFDKNNFNYTITVSADTDTIAVNAVSTVNGASVVVNGNTDIQNGSVITIDVTALDNETKNTYRVVVKKKTDWGMIVKYAVLGIGLLLVIFIVYKMIKTMNDKNKNDPIYKLKQKRKIENKGAKTDLSAIPSVGNTNGNVNTTTPANSTVQPVVTAQVQPTVTPTVTPQVQPAVTPTITPQVQPVVTPPVTAQVQPQVVNNQVNQNNQNQ